jgi:hypothetical protein
MAEKLATVPPDLWEKHVMALDDVTDRLKRITVALEILLAKLGR